MEIFEWNIWTVSIKYNAIYNAIYNLSYGLTYATYDLYECNVCLAYF